MLSIGQTFLGKGMDKMKNALCLIIPVALCLLLIGCTASMLKDDTMVSSQTQAINRNIPDLYKTLLKDYCTIVDFRLSDNFEADWNSDYALELSDDLQRLLLDSDNSSVEGNMSLAANWSNMVVEMVNGLSDASPEDFGYILCDINNDAHLEMFWVRKDGVILCAFTTRRGQLVLIDAFWSDHRCIVTGCSALYTVTTGGAGYCSYNIQELSPDGTLTTIVSFGTEGLSLENQVMYYKVVGSHKQQIDKDQFAQLLNEYPFSANSTWLKQEITYLDA